MTMEKADMTEEKTLTQAEWHKQQAVAAFNGTWDLIDKTERTAEELRQMIHMAHASRFHWGHAGKEAQWATGEWQISRVYALAGLGESALFHGEADLAYCEQGSLTPFDYTFAYEAIARAHHVLGNPEEKAYYLEKAKTMAAGIADENNRNYALSELNF